MKYVSKRVVIEALKITGTAKAIADNATMVNFESGEGMVLVSSQPILPGDYVNITDPEDIYHMPAKIIDGPAAKYEKIV